MSAHVLDRPKSQRPISLGKTVTLVLPRTARLAHELLARDEHMEAMCAAWGIVGADLFSNGDDLGEFRFPSGWYISAARGNSMCRRLIDPLDRDRAHILTRETLNGPSVLIILPRYFTTLEHDENERVRVVAIDRDGMRLMRVTHWRAHSENTELTEDIRIYEEWLDDIRPYRNDPFYYW